MLILRLTILLRFALVPASRHMSWRWRQANGVGIRIATDQHHPPMLTCTYLRPENEAAAMPQHHLFFFHRKEHFVDCQYLRAVFKTYRYIIKNELMAGRHFHKTIVTHRSPRILFHRKYHPPLENNADAQAIESQQASQAFLPVAVCGAPLSQASA